MTTNNDCYYQNLVDDCRGLLQEVGDPPLKHIFKEANEVGDKLAKQGNCPDLFGSLMLFYVPPTFVASTFEKDKMGTMSPKQVSLCNDS